MGYSYSIFKIFCSSEDRLAYLVNKTDWDRNIDGTVDARKKDFRELNQLAQNSPFPITKAGKIDMRCTRNPAVLQLKLAKLLEKSE